MCTVGDLNLRSRLGFVTEITFEGILETLIHFLFGSFAARLTILDFISTARASSISSLLARVSAVF